MICCVQRYHVTFFLVEFSDLVYKKVKKVSLVKIIHSA